MGKRAWGQRVGAGCGVREWDSMGTFCVQNQNPESIRMEVSVAEDFGGEKWGLAGSHHSETRAMLNPYCWRSFSAGSDGKVGLGEGQ